MENLIKSARQKLDSAFHAQRVKYEGAVLHAENERGKAELEATNDYISTMAKIRDANGGRQKMTLIRGIPGSGKSTLARKIARDTGAAHYEADQYFMDRGQYCFDHKHIKSAHSMCYVLTVNAIKSGWDVVVSNTFIQHWEMQRYIDIAASYGVDVEIIVCRANHGSVHGVPEEKIKIMAERWEE